MAVVGKMEVDLYANSTPFIQGMRAGEAAAKKSAAGIGASIEKINKKQLANVAGNMIKAAGIVGIVDKAFRIGADFMNEFTRGGDFEKTFKKIGDQLLESLSSVPVVGAAYELGKAIGDYITDGAMSAEEAQKKSRIEGLAKQKKFIEDMQREETKLKEDADKAKIAENLQKEKEETEQSNRELEDFWDRREAASSKILDMEKTAHELSMSERDILLDELRKMDDITDAEIERGMKAFDTIKAHDLELKKLESIKKEQEEIADAKEKAQQDLNAAYVAYSEEEAELAKKAETATSATSLDTAIGSVKVEGAMDYSIEKQLETAKDQLEAAQTSVEYLKIIAGQLGGTV